MPTGNRPLGDFPARLATTGLRPLSRIVNPMSRDCSHEDFAVAMGIDWMPKAGFRPTNELREAIPPVYTEHVGHYLAQHIKATRREAA